ncbi:BNR-4 repeat-containing protein [Actinoplanes sp. GCM10030250]|uniref:BNR-4 repeat-containing protein n=1 Tax=Actinoplanes sp. GCM10030250 TaxID=3273376 RepID=UPI00360D7727
MRRAPLIALSAAAVLVAAAAVPGHAGAAVPVSRTGPSAAPTSFTTVATNVAARSDRRPTNGGVYDRTAQKTFISWAGQFEDNYVQAYDHRAKIWSAPVKVADGGNDTHNYPTLIQAGDGHLLVFRGMHNRELWFARSERPHSIEGTWTDTQIPEGLGATYPMVFKSTAGHLFVFVRETAGDLDKQYPTDFRPMKYVRSTDNGRTWQSSETLTGERWNIAPQTRTDNMNEVYIGQLRHEPGAPGRPERVSIVYTLAGGGPEGHLHDRYHKNIYHAYFSPADLKFRSAAGADLGVKIDDADQERHLKVAETPLQTVNPRSPDYIQLVGSTVGGFTPFVVWMQLDEAAVVHTYTGVFTPLGWRNREVASGIRVRDMERVDALTWRVYATTNDPAVTAISTFKLYAGAFWQSEATIPVPRAVQRIEVIDGYRDPARIIVSGASSARPADVADGDIYVAGAGR